MTTIYTASKTRHAPKWRRLQTLGVPVIASWLDEECPEDKSKDVIPGLWVKMVEEAAGCGAVLAYFEPGEIIKGALVEVGAALAMGKPVFVCGCKPDYPYVKEWGSWLRHPLVTLCKDLNDALTQIGNLGNKE